MSVMFQMENTNAQNLDKDKDKDLDKDQLKVSIRWASGEHLMDHMRH